MQDKKPISKSVEMKLKKLRERLAKKEAQERVEAYQIPARDQDSSKRSDH
jgi:hypothetical protein